VFRRRVLVLLIPAVLGALGVSRAGQDAPRRSSDDAAHAVSERLTGLLAQAPKDTEIGLVVRDCHSGETWFACQPQRPLKPASVMKLFTTAAALERFGPDFTFETRVYLCEDELLVLGEGDPGLGDERIAERHGQPLHAEFDHWARLLKTRGLTSVKTIALDDGIFDRRFRHPDWPDQQATAWYQAPVGGLCFNDNCLDARFTARNGKVTLRLQPDLPVSFFRNELTAGTEHKPVVSRALDQDLFVFRGPVARDGQFQPISVCRPTVFFGFALQRALEERGVILRGQVVRRTLKPTALAEAELLDVHSTSLRDVLWRCNTFSQNMFAECLLKSLAAYNPDGSRSGVAASWDSGIRVLEATLRQLGVDLEGAVFRDGSGLSHENRVTADQVVQVLVRMRRHAAGELYVDSLAQPGRDGTLRRPHWNVPALQNRLRAKTGTINRVHALAGYVDRADGRTLAFALLANGELPHGFRVRVAETLAEAGVRTQP
jgi:D-alanyl-D-alanine carboxypeptidase/D-alanyl-D-alanine-endopeptidase (penicillin-binding protein 4)